jgi:hypothetical protein
MEIDAAGIAGGGRIGVRSGTVENLLRKRLEEGGSGLRG